MPSSKRKRVAAQPIDLRNVVTHHQRCPWWNTAEPPDRCDAGWTSNAVTDLAACHKFPTDFPLENHLLAAWTWFEHHQQVAQRPPVTGKSIAIVLREISRSASALRDALARGAAPVRVALNRAIEHAVEIDPLMTDLRELEVSAEIALTNIDASNGGRPVDRAFRSLLFDGCRIYLRAFGVNAPTITKADTYSGPLFAWCTDLFGAFKVNPKTNDAMGKAIERTLARLKRQST